MNLKFSHFKQIHKNGYTLDMIFLLELSKNNQDIDLKAICEESPKMEALYNTLIRKGLITDKGKLSTVAEQLLEFIATEEEEVVFKKKRPEEDVFEKWWKAYPGTDTFKYKEKTFTGSRNLRANKTECMLKLHSILEEGEYTIDEMVQALEYDVTQKKENSVKTGANKLTYMQNSLTYLNQRSFEPFIELIKEGVVIQDTPIITGGTDI